MGRVWLGRRTVVQPRQHLRNRSLLPHQAQSLVVVLPVLVVVLMVAVARVPQGRCARNHRLPRVQLTVVLVPRLLPLLEALQQGPARQAVRAMRRVWAVRRVRGRWT